MPTLTTSAERNWTSLHATKVAHGKFLAKSKASRFNLIELVDVAADYIDGLTVSQIAKIIEAKNTAAPKGRKAGAR